MMRKRSPYGHQRHNNNNRGGGGQVRRHHRRDGNSNNTQYEQYDDEHVSPRQRRHAQIQREKYVNMAIDARRSGDRVQAEYWLQHADHYQRILNVAQEQFASRGPSQEEGDEGQDNGGGMNGGESSGSNYQQQSQNDGFSSEGGMEEDAYEPSYGTPAPQQEQPRRQQHQGGGQRRQHQQRRPRQEQHQQQDRADNMQGGLEDVLPMPKPERSDQRFDQDDE